MRYLSRCSDCGSVTECVGAQALVGHTLEWDIGHHCPSCGMTLHECGPGGGDMPEDLRGRLLAEHGTARVALGDPPARPPRPATVMKVLRAEFGGGLADAKRMLQQIRDGVFVGTMPETALLVERLRAAGVEAEAERLPPGGDQVR
ncbi:hypothetical protein [Streptomyces sp. NPDC056672]|uniref:hypothetical protein n=1 Tax=Streptomyces sp. NPDC056672 TaxID=3345906 RepID=UPI0036CFE197